MLLCACLLLVLFLVWSGLVWCVVRHDSCLVFCSSARHRRVDGWIVEGAWDGSDGILFLFVISRPGAARPHRSAGAEQGDLRHPRVFLMLGIFGSACCACLRSFVYDYLILRKDGCFILSY